MECVLSLVAVVDALRCRRLRWAAAEGGGNGSDVIGMGRENNRTAVGEWFEMVSFENILGIVHVV